MKNIDGESIPLRPARGLIRWRKWLKPFISRRSTPEAIAGGFALGFLIAFTPTLGIQILLSYCLATMLKLSRAAALIPIWVTTPFTAPPIYAFTYMIGNFFTGGPSVRKVRSHLETTISAATEYDALDVSSRFSVAMNLGSDIFLPMLIGGLMIGGVCAAVSYPAILYLVRRVRRRRESRRHHRQRFRLRRAERRESEPI